MSYFPSFKEWLQILFMTWVFLMSIIILAGMVGITIYLIGFVLQFLGVL